MNGNSPALEPFGRTCSSARFEIRWCLETWLVRASCPTPVGKATKSRSLIQAAAFDVLRLSVIVTQPVSAFVVGGRWARGRSRFRAKPD